MALLTDEVLEKPAGPAPLGYLATLDGLRAAAALAVVAYHVEAGPLRGGFLGVDLFFVLSGFLITRLLLEERSASGRVSLSRFWSRRARRLLPAMAAVVAVACAWSWFAQGAVARRQTGTDAVASLLYVANWHFIRESASYFAPLADASPLRHLWSLSVEEQWYLLWPLVVVVVLRRAGARTLAVVCGVAALASAAWMFHLVQVADLDRAYYGTDTRAHSLLIGSLLAAASIGWPRLEDRLRGCTGNRIGLVSLGVLAAAVVMAGASDPWMYRGGFLLVAVASAGLVAWLAFGFPSPVHRVFASHPAVWLGKRSYAIYLWHWPVVVALTADVVGVRGPALGLLQAVLSVALAAVSFWVIEQPVRFRLPARRGLAATGGVLGVAAVVAVALVASGTALPTMRPGDVVSILPEPATVAAAPALASPAVVASPAGDSGGSSGGSAAPAATTAPEPARSGANAVSPTAPPAPTTTVPPPPLRVALLGDSQVAVVASEWGNAPLPGVELAASGTVGCGIASTPLASVEGYRVIYAGGACDTWEQDWRNLVATTQPDVVVIMIGPWEVVDPVVDGKVLSVGTPEHDAWLLGRLRLALAAAGSSGAPVAVLDVPCYDAGDGVLSMRAERDDPARIARVNALMQQAVDEAGQTILRQSDFVCPGGVARTAPDGTSLRYDGVHYSAEGVRELWQWLLPELHQVVSPTPPVGAW